LAWIVAALVVATLGLSTACTPEAEREAQQDMNEAEADLERATDQAGEEMREMGAAMERGIERANERLEPYMADAEVTAKVKTRLAADPEVNPFRIDVDTIDGTVTLSGMVSSEAEKAEAEKLARNTEGVVAVVNNLTVGQRGG
jgi:osmotically-inducible protein OsmY